MKLSKEICFLVLLTLIAALLRVYNLGGASLWMDELTQVNFYTSSKNIWSVITSAAGQNQPPLDYMIGYWVSKFLAFSEESVRLPACIFGVLTIPISYFLFKNIFNKTTAFLTCFWLSISPPLIAYSQEARPYSIFFFFYLLVLLFYFKSFESKRWYKGKKIFIFITFLMLISRGMAPVVVLISLFLSLSILSLWERKFIFVKETFLTFLKIGLLFSPVFIFVFLYSKKYLQVSTNSAQPQFNFLDPAIQLYSELIPANIAPLSWFIFIGTLLSTYFLLQNRKENSAKILFVFFVILQPLVHVYLFYFSVNLSLHYPSERYFVHEIFGLFVISTYGFQKLFEKLPRPIYFTTLLCLFLLAPLFYTQNILDYYKKEKTDYRSVMQYLNLHLGKNDVVVYKSPVRYGSWEPGLYGVRQYGQNSNLFQRDLQSWTEILHWNSEFGSNIFFVKQGPLMLNEVTDNDVEIIPFYEIILYKAKKQSLSTTEQTKLILNKLLTIFPDDSSKVDIYISLANLSCRTNSTQSRDYLLKAQSLLTPSEKKEFEVQFLTLCQKDIEINEQLKKLKPMELKHNSSFESESKFNVLLNNFKIAEIDLNNFKRGPNRQTTTTITTSGLLNFIYNQKIHIDSILDNNYVPQGHQISYIHNDTLDKKEIIYDWSKKWLTALNEDGSKSVSPLIAKTQDAFSLIYFLHSLDHQKESLFLYTQDQRMSFIKTTPEVTNNERSLKVQIIDFKTQAIKTNLTIYFDTNDSVDQIQFPLSSKSNLMNLVIQRK